jgi:hypothetical protein
MAEANARTPIIHAVRTAGAPAKVSLEVQALHRRCGIYTKPEVVCDILDAVGWHGKADLSRSRLLEPACGDGAFVVEAARRLLVAYARRGRELRVDTLRNRIAAFEIHPREARVARSRVADTLRAAGVHKRTAEACARSWIIDGDFLLANVPSDCFTHAVGNPPYVRWSRIPHNLKENYEARLPRDMARGDLFLPFLDRVFESLRPNGMGGFLCSDRWRFMAFAEAFRKKWLPNLSIESERSVTPADAFLDDVDSYPTVLIASKRRAAKRKAPRTRTGRGKTLEELGCVIRVGPALGHTPAYVLNPDENDVEPELLRPWVDGSEIKEGAVQWGGRRVIVMHGGDGKLIDPKLFPLLKARLKRFRGTLKQRSIVENGAPWFRPIDRVLAADWTRPKLLVPELAKIPRVAIDRSGAVPSHGVYAIFAPDDDAEGLYERLCDGKLAKAIEKIAPKVKGGYVRCYRRFLQRVSIQT